MLSRVLTILIIIIAVVLALCSTILSNITTVMIISRFFETMLPVLAVGALIKYLFYEAN